MLHQKDLDRSSGKLEWFLSDEELTIVPFAVDQEVTNLFNAGKRGLQAEPWVLKETTIPHARAQV